MYSEINLTVVIALIALVHTLLVFKAISKKETMTKYITSIVIILFLSGISYLMFDTYKTLRDIDLEFEKIGVEILRIDTEMELKGTDFISDKNDARLEYLTLRKEMHDLNNKSNNISTNTDLLLLIMILMLIAHLATRK